MQAADFRTVEAQARRSFKYAVIDTSRWGVYVAEVLGGKAWVGDCIDLVSTEMEILAERGQPLNRIWRLLVIDQESDASITQPDHAVAAVTDDDGAFWVIADTFGTMYPAAELKHRPFCYNRLDEVDDQNEPTWRAGLPWQADSA